MKREKTIEQIMAEEDAAATKLSSQLYFKTAKIETLKNGEFIRKVGKKRVFTKEAYCRLNKGYQIDACDDISVAYYLKKGTLVEYDFEF